MGTSFVEYGGFGFWARDAALEKWLLTLVDELTRHPDLEPWQRSLADYWREQAGIDGGCMSLALDEYITDDARRRAVLAIAQEAVQKAAPIAQRTAALFIELLEGKLKSTAFTPTDYLD